MKNDVKRALLIKYLVPSAVVICGFLSFLNFSARAAEQFIIVASTTSTVNSGLFEKLMPTFKEKTGIEVRVVGVGTGQAIEIARRGDADVLFVHHEKSEIDFVESGFGVRRYAVMYNDFVIVGPNGDPAGLHEAEDVISAYQKIWSAKTTFVSRGDDSGTHKKSLEFWMMAREGKINSKETTWYQEVGAGMGATLNIAREMEGYTLTDRATWESFQKKGSLVILFQGDPRMRNPYSIIMVNSSRHKHIKVNLASIFINWMVSSEGQRAINGFRINGKQTFFASAAY
jgi:tungstate transport system substrate-binding protein